MIHAGMNVARLNFSHGTQAEHGHKIQTIRSLSAGSNMPVAILQDLCGPKIRVGRLKGGGPVELRDGSTIVIATDEGLEGDELRIATTYAALARDVSPGDRILLDDGNLAVGKFRMSNHGRPTWIIEE